MRCSLLSSVLLALVPSVAAQVVVDEAETNITTDCVEADAFDPNFDYFEGLKYAVTDYTPELVSDLGTDAFEDNKVNLDGTTDLFSITYHNHYKILTNHQMNKTYLLYMCGTQEQIPTEELEAGKHHLVLSIPHTGGVAITQTTQIPYMELLGLRREIIAYIGDPQYITSPCLLHLINEENSVELVYDRDDPWNSTSTAALQAEFLEEHPDAIVLGGPFHDPDGDRSVIVLATQERTTVATFDWIGFYAAFFNLESMSNQIAADTKARFDCSASNAATLSANREEQPKVLWATYYQSYNWSVVQCPTWDSAYYCEYASHCGAEIISRPEGYGQTVNGYWYLNDEQFVELGKDADIFILASLGDKIYEQKKEALDQLKAVQNEQFYDTYGQGQHTWHEQRLAEYDVVALDFCDVVGTASNTGTGEAHTRRWLRNVLKEPMGSLPACNVPDDIDEPYVAIGAACSPLEEASASTNTAADDNREVSGEDNNDVSGGGNSDALGAASKGFSLAFAGAWVFVLISSVLSIAM
ncbi:expressed unknown protein [Seminavis robusta]|uniref:Uncharacterized protein n=1 Tax=Seminavis robusta TaxID=568900 RepID=A0A9N8DY71_9STRA|nr:expressed unknown protein [Seminavis robusta]|eukprot:Sro439_g143300.1 n/a (527) ;mRNA; r:58213-59988